MPFKNSIFKKTDTRQGKGFHIWRNNSAKMTKSKRTITGLCRIYIIAKGYAKKSKTEAASGKTWYLPPHHGVYHPSKPGKTRVMFDLSPDYKGRCHQGTSSPSYSNFALRRTAKDKEQ